MSSSMRVESGKWIGPGGTVTPGVMVTIRLAPESTPTPQSPPQTGCGHKEFTSGCQECKKEQDELDRKMFSGVFGGNKEEEKSSQPKTSSACMCGKEGCTNFPQELLQEGGPFGNEEHTKEAMIEMFLMGKILGLL